MKKTSLYMAAAVAVLGFASAAQAADDWRAGLYIKGAGAWTSAAAQKYATPPIDVKADMKGGYAASAGVGYEFHPGVRAEFEITHRRNNVKNIKVNGVTQAAQAGHTASTAYMGNIYYDMDTGTEYTPYIGLGLGVAHANAKSNTRLGPIAVSGTDTVFAYQAMGGVEYALDRNFGIYGEYRYFATPKLRVKDSVGAKHKVDNNVHNFGLGLRYKFD